MKNIFVVGYARSGTTLLQTYVSAIPSVASFPETNYFFSNYVCPLDRIAVLPRIADLVCIPRRIVVDRHALSLVIKEIGVEYPAIKKRILPTKQYDQLFVSFLNTVAERRLATAWVEKSTVHLRRISRIVAVSPEAIFIHLIRRFPAVLDSWNRAGKEYDDWIFTESNKKIYRNWVRDLKRTEFWVNRRPDRHIGFTYEELCNSPNNVIQSISEFCGLAIGNKVLENRKQHINVNISLEPWKANVYNDIRSLKCNDKDNYFDKRGRDEYCRVLQVLEKHRNLS